MLKESRKKLWKYVNPDVESSYRENNLGRTLYDEVLKHKPKIIIEFGVLNGYSTIAMALALKRLGEGKIIGYDLWEKYPYKHTTKEKTLENLKRYGVDDIVELREMDFKDFYGQECDMAHIDISNTGDIIDQLPKKFGKAIVLFEGGTYERDNVEWVKKYNKRKIRDSKVPFNVINPDFPSISKLC